MNPKHLRARIDQCLRNAELSRCLRRKFGAMLLDPKTNSIVSDGYNGPPRGEIGLCSGSFCERDGRFPDHPPIASGTHMEKGCHHAESNVIANAARRGSSTADTWLLVTGEPCLMCAKLIHHAGVARVYVVQGGYAGGDDGPAYLRNHGVEVEYVEGPQDPRKVV